MKSETASGEMSAFWKGIDPGVAAGLTEAQKTAIAAAARRQAESARPADIRMSFGGYFLALTLGRERRNRQRIEAERAERPAFTAKNLPALVCIWGALIYLTLAMLGIITRIFYSVMA